MCETTKKYCYSPLMGVSPLQATPVFWQVVLSIRYLHSWVERGTCESSVCPRTQHNDPTNA